MIHFRHFTAWLCLTSYPWTVGSTWLTVSQRRWRDRGGRRRRVWGSRLSSLVWEETLRWTCLGVPPTLYLPLLGLLLCLLWVLLHLFLRLLLLMWWAQDAHGAGEGLGPIHQQGGGDSPLVGRCNFTPSCVRSPPFYVSVVFTPHFTLFGLL